MLFAAVIGLAAVAAQEKRDQKKPAAPAEKKKDATKEKAAPAKARQAPVAVKAIAPQLRVRAQFTVEMFEQWVFQQVRDEVGGRQRFDQFLTLHLDYLDRICQLTDNQKRKLQLAARGDIQRFFDQYEMVKRKFHDVKDDELKMQQMWQDINQLQTYMADGLFGDDSLVYKSLRHTLSAEQLAKYDVARRERSHFLHRTGIEQGVAILERGVPLRDAQRQDLIALIVSRSTPPTRIVHEGWYQYDLVMYTLARIPPEILKPLFDASQWKVVNRLRGQAWGFRSILKQNGLLPEDEADADTADAKPTPGK
jgi:hypothetical protein